MRIRPVSIVTLGVGLFAGSLAVGVAIQSCSTTPGTNLDAGNETGPCSDGTIQLLGCEAVDGAPPAEVFTDEACRALDDAEHRTAVIHDAVRAPTVTAPTEAQPIPNATPFVFTWRPGSVSWRLPVRGAVPSPRMTVADAWDRWTTLIPSAYAHCPPYSGVAYAAVFRANGQEVLRAETSHLTYTPTADAWTRLRALRGTVELRVEAVRFGTSTVSDGPYDQTVPRTFTIAP